MADRLLMADVLRSGPENGTIGQPYRAPVRKAIGSLADLINAFAARAEKVGVTVPQGSPVLPGASMTLRDMTVGDLGRVLEDISYGMGPVSGGNYATGGVGTYGLKPDAMELANVAPAGALLGKGIVKGGKALAPTAAEMLRQRAEKYMRDSGNLREIIAYHGTPHNWQPEPGFPDGRFRLDRMGTGEGAQAYGWGAYFAENPDVAGSYRNALADWYPGGIKTKPGTAEDAAAAHVAAAIDGQYGNPYTQAKEWIRRQGGERAAEKIAAIEKWQREGIEFKKPGSVYELDIPDEAVARMLDWDAPLGQQPHHVQDAWQSLMQEKGMPFSNSELIGDVTKRAMLEEDLRKRGIPGLRFLDEGSRGAVGPGTRNIVIWDQDVLDEAAKRGIKKK